MKYFIWSDGHRTSGKRNDDGCIIRRGKPVNIDKEALKWRDSFKPDVTVYLGDWLDRDQARLKDIMEAHPLIFEDLRRKNTIYIPGNHDWMNRAFYQTSMTVEARGGIRAHWDHGHQNDPHMSAWYTDAGTWLLGGIERIYPNADYPESWKIWSKGKKKPKIERNVEAYVRSFIGEVDIKFTGHDHIPKIIELSDKWDRTIIWADPGHNTNGHLQAIQFNGDTGKLKAVRDHV